ncbi:MAG: aminopeptidase P family protein [Neisseriaceae bacterium]|nr:aminopeptidase P family protein [Neisseriaceae bacterium]
MTIATRLAHLREKMKQYQLDAWIVPTSDPHLSEYLPEHWQVRAWLTGFTGSAGVAVVLAEQALLWTDSRYWEQATQQLSGSNIVLKKQGLDESYWQYLVNTLPENARVGIAADMLSWADKQLLQQHFSRKKIELITDFDLIDECWQHRPKLPENKIFVHENKWVGQTTTEKLARIRQAMQTYSVDFHLISSLDDIAWITNLRGSDVSFNPVFLAHLLIDKQQSILFVDNHKLDENVQAALKTANITWQDYHQIGDYLQKCSGSVLIEGAKTAVSVLQKLPENVKIIDETLPSSLMKAQKTEKECAHIRQAMRQDGAALCGFFAEFENKIAQNNIITEYDIGEMLYRYRAAQPYFLSESFATIAAFNANAAMPHYQAEKNTCSTLSGSGLLLIDSGAQYLNGTTDITRVIPIGTPNDAQKRDFTLVLKAHIALAKAVFPENTLSPMIDAICRAPLWQAQCDFGHGTGHGVGYCLNVHEGPQRISYQSKTQAQQAMKEGMLTSNEPSLYRPNQWGIRIENLMLNQKVTELKEQQFGKFLCFETVTLCPIDTRLIMRELLNEEEITWLNHYHQRVKTELESMVSGDAKAWLHKRTEKI